MEPAERNEFQEGEQRQEARPLSGRLALTLLAAGAVSLVLADARFALLGCGAAAVMIGRAAIEDEEAPSWRDGADWVLGLAGGVLAALFGALLWAEGQAEWAACGALLWVGAILHASGKWKAKPAFAIAEGAPSMAAMFAAPAISAFLAPSPAWTPILCVWAASLGVLWVMERSSGVRAIGPRAAFALLGQALGRAPISRARVAPLSEARDLRAAAPAVLELEAEPEPAPAPLPALAGVVILALEEGPSRDALAAVIGELGLDWVTPENAPSRDLLAIIVEAETARAPQNAAMRACLPAIPFVLCGSRNDAALAQEIGADAMILAPASTHSLGAALAQFHASQMRSGKDLARTA